MIRALLLVPLLGVLPGVLLGGCVTYYSLVEKGKRVEMGGLYSIQSDVAWSRVSQDKNELWTIDGPALQEVLFVNGVAEDESLWKVSRAKAEDLPRFHASMTPIEIAEAVQATLLRDGYGKADVTDLRPAAFGPFDGFRFDLSLVSRHGLEKRGVTLGTVADGKLWLIVYVGVRVHYYAKTLPLLETMVDSIRDVQSSS